jgi:hypothetical protein
MTDIAPKMSMLESKTDIRKEWLVRTKTREVIGPFTQSELYSALNSHLFTLEDEIAQSGGFWVSAQALSYREEDDFTRTSTRSQVVAENTQTVAFFVFCCHIILQLLRALF